MIYSNKLRKLKRDWWVTYFQFVGVNQHTERSGQTEEGGHTSAQPHIRFAHTKFDRAWCCDQGGTWSATASAGAAATRGAGAGSRARSTTTGAPEMCITSKKRRFEQKEDEIHLSGWSLGFIIKSFCAVRCLIHPNTCNQMEISIFKAGIEREDILGGMYILSLSYSAHSTHSVIIFCSQNF